MKMYAFKLLLGWGRTSGGGPAANVLQQAKLPLVSHENCRRKYGTVDRSAHLCAGEGRAGASGGCNGDSGGPLVCEMGGSWYLHGAVSFGMRNCPTTHYTVFARITSYKSWILEKIGWFKMIDTCLKNETRGRKKNALTLNRLITKGEESRVMESGKAN